VIEISNEDDSSSMLIHYNLLKRSLLVNESSLTKLSRSYESHSTFRRLFDEIIYSNQLSKKRELIDKCV